MDLKILRTWATPWGRHGSTEFTLPETNSLRLQKETHLNQTPVFQVRAVSGRVDLNHLFQKWIRQVFGPSGPIFTGKAEFTLGIAGVMYYRVDPCGGRVYLQKNSRHVVLGLCCWGRKLRFYYILQFLMALGLKTSIQVTYSDVLCTREVAFQMMVWDLQNFHSQHDHVPSVDGCLGEVTYC